MRPVKLRIEGAYWDSQIYSGELFLFTEESSLVKVWWRTLVNTLAKTNTDVQTALRVGFIDGDLFYNSKVRNILKDPAIEAPIKNQLDTLSSRSLALNLSSSVGAQEVSSPFDFSLADTDIYYGTIIAAGEEGLFSYKASKLQSLRTRSKSIKHHDASFLQVKASNKYTAVAAAAGSDGLLEFVFDPKEEHQTLGDNRVLSPRSCKACDWSFESVLGWSETSAFLAKFKAERYQSEMLRLFDRVVDFDEIFDAAGSDSVEQGFSWGAREKLYRFGSDGIQVVDLADHTSKKRKGAGIDETNGTFRGVIKSKFSSEEVISTSTAPFGTVIEFSDRLVVLRSDGLVDEFENEPLHWRIFPRSDLYSNQLHIIYEDHIDIISFVHDYFVDQNEKISGFTRNSSDMDSDSLF